MILLGAPDETKVDSEEAWADENSLVLAEKLVVVLCAAWELEKEDSTAETEADADAAVLLAIAELSNALELSIALLI